MKKLVVIDGNSILNRAFYGIMGSKMLMTNDGTYTNAVYGFLAIMFKMLEDENPEYLAIAFDVKAPTKRHELYSEYKGTRHGMPDELKAQMPLIKEVLKAMNIKLYEKEGYEADDILGTLAKFGEENGLEVKLLTGDRDSFQLATNKTTIMIPHTKAGKTETDYYNRDKVFEVYGVEPKQMIEVKGLMGDSSDNIPGVAGIGEKTALSLIQKYKSIDGVYKAIDEKDPEIKGKTLEKLVDGKDMAYLSRTLGTIDVNSPIEKVLEDLERKEWNRQEVLRLFKELRFNRYISRFELDKENSESSEKAEEAKDIKDLFQVQKLEDFSIFENKDKIYYYFETKESSEEKPISQDIVSVSFCDLDKVYTCDYKENKEKIKEIFENENILKVGYDEKKDYILLKQDGIQAKNMMYDVKIAGYLLNSNSNQYKIKDLAFNYLNLDIDSFSNEKEESQESLFDEKKEEKPNLENELNCYVISKLPEVLDKKLEEIGSTKLFKEIEMPLVEVLAEMQYIGMYADEKEIYKFGETLKSKLEELRIDIYKLAGEEFNVNSTQQLGRILFEKLELPIVKKTKTGYSTDNDVLEKLRDKNPIIEKILDYRQIMKLSSTYVDGLIPHINPKTGRIHTNFHQTVTATGRLSSSDPNLQNIPTRTELGKKVRKVFKPASGKIFVDADYSQIELRILAHLSEDETMVNAFNDEIDIHTITASKIFGVPVDMVSKQLRSRAKAVNFGIVYGISEFGLAEQTGINRKEAKDFMEQYLEHYSGIKKYMEDVVEEAKSKGYIDTMFGRRRYIQELKSNNYMVRKFGERIAMNTGVQGTAADIMKIAMINVYNRLKRENMEAKIVLQVHDELLVETPINEKEKVKEILVEEMENVTKLKVPLKVEAEEGKNWLAAK